jgi:ssDNA-binding Zn-finger/Zn-ribbon topoisomerase 1
MPRYLTPPPKPPLSRLIREGTVGDCPECGSTTVRENRMWDFFGIGEKVGCIQPKCDNYYQSIEKNREKTINDVLS